MSRACMRCGQLEGGKPFVGVGGVILCERCAIAGLCAPCGDFHHTFYGALCTACGYTISHRQASEPPQVPKPLVYIDDD